MDKIPTESEINAASGLIVAITTLVGLVIRAIEKRRDKRRLKQRIRDGQESIYENSNTDFLN